jgi:hypothetical protein
MEWIAALCIAIEQYSGKPDFFWLFERILVVFTVFDYRNDVFRIESVACAAQKTEKAGGYI